MILILRVEDLSGFVEKFEERMGMERQESVRVMNSEGVVQVSHHRVFHWMMADIYVGIPDESSVLFVGSEGNVHSALKRLGLPMEAFDQSFHCSK